MVCRYPNVSQLALLCSSWSHSPFENARFQNIRGWLSLMATSVSTYRHIAESRNFFFAHCTYHCNSLFLLLVKVEATCSHIQTMQFHSTFTPHAAQGYSGCHDVYRKIVCGQFLALIKVWYLNLRRLQNFSQVKIYWPNWTWIFNSMLLSSGPVLSCLHLPCLVRLIFGQHRFFLRWICLFI